MQRPDIQPLRPRSIGLIFEPDWSSGTRLLPGFIGAWTPTFRILAQSIVLVLGLLALASRQGVLTGHPGVPSALEIIFFPRTTTQIALPLLEDPVGVIVIVAAILTPLLCLAQVSAIHHFVDMNVDNIPHRYDDLHESADQINELVNRANKRFTRIGSWWMSLLLVAGAAALSWTLLSLVQRHGLLHGWNNTSMNDDVWQQQVYNGWWANIHRHPTMAIALTALGTYLFYFLAKQLAMGFTFAIFASTALRCGCGFGVAPRLRYNSDGYWGLRRLRRFMQWTYASAMVHFVTTIGVFVVWLPFGQWTVFAVISVALLNAAVVLYPSWLAAVSSEKEKTLYVKHIDQDPGLDHATRELLIGRVWEFPNLPFRIRSALSAILLYLLIPLILAIVSGLLSRN